MKRSHILKMSLALLVSAGAVSALLAQTGPSGPVTPTPAPGVVAQPNLMTPVRLANLLRADGHQVETKTFQNGAQTVIATVVRDGWRFVIEFEFNNTGTNMNVMCPLGNPASQFSGAQLLGLMKKSYDLPVPLHFSYRASDQRLILEDPCYNTGNMTDAGLRNILDRIVRTVRETHNLWDTSRWPVNPTSPVAQK